MTASRFRQIRLLAAALVGAAALSIGCGGSTPTPSDPSATTTAPASASSPPSAAPSPSAAVSPSPSPTPGLGLPHVNAQLEDLLPSTIGGVAMQKLSMPLSTYIASSRGGDKALLAPWAVHFGTTPAEIDLAAATDLTEQISFFVQAIQVPGAKPAELTGEFARLARQAGWPVLGQRVATRPVLEITDPEAEAAGKLATAYILAVDDVMYVIVTDDSALLVEALIKLPE